MTHPTAHAAVNCDDRFGNWEVTMTGHMRYSPQNMFLVRCLNVYCHVHCPDSSPLELLAAYGAEAKCQSGDIPAARRRDLAGVVGLLVQWLVSVQNPLLHSDLSLAYDDRKSSGNV